MKALEGVKVVDLGQFYLAPYATMLMERLGATVIKLEAPAGDPYRRLATVDAEGNPIQFCMLNAGKKTIRVDLRQEGGREVVRRLATWADILVQNLSPGAMDRFDLGYDRLHEINPRLIMASGTGFGSFGPYAGEPAMDLTVQARTAIMSTTGFEDGTPVRTGPSVVDFMGGAHLIAAVLAALYQRTVTGRGQHVEVALQDAIIPSLTSNIAGYIASGGTVPERTGNRHGGMAVAPYNAYETTDGWVTVLCPTDVHWLRLCELMADPATDDPRLLDMASRCTNMGLVDEIVGRWAGTRNKADVTSHLNKINVPCAAVVTLPELLVDEHVKARGVLRHVSDEKGTFLTLGSPLFLSDSPTSDPARPGALGEHTDTILRDELGFTENELLDLRAAGAI